MSTMSRDNTRSGGRGIRTPGACDPTVFKTVAIVRSAIPPESAVTSRPSTICPQRREPFRVLSPLIEPRRRRASEPRPATGYEPRNLTSPSIMWRSREAVPDDLVGDVALDLDDEAVVAECLLGRPRLDARQVDACGPRTGRGCRAGCRDGPPAGSRRSSCGRGPSAAGRRPGRRARSGCSLPGWSSIAWARTSSP